MPECPFEQRLCADCDSLVWADPDETEVHCYIHDRMHAKLEGLAQ